jgi:hypothetical protein
MKIVAPSLEETRAAITELQSRDLHRTSVDELKDGLVTVLNGYQITRPNFEPGGVLFRGRAFRDRPLAISDLWYPRGAMARMNRANRAGAPMLYCCASRDPIPFELDLVPGDRVAVLCVKTTAPMLVNQVGYTEGAFARLKAVREIPEYGRLEVHRYDDRNALVHDFLAEVFSEPIPRGEDWRYTMSVAVAEKLLGSPFAGLMYPTLPHCLTSNHQCLRPTTTALTSGPANKQRSVSPRGRIPTMAQPVNSVATRMGSSYSERGHCHHITTRLLPSLQPIEEIHHVL